MSNTESRGRPVIDINDPNSRPGNYSPVFHFNIWEKGEPLITFAFDVPKGHCGNGCVDCEHSYHHLESKLDEVAQLSYAEGLSVNEAATVSKSYADQIDADLKFLQHQLSIHGDSIMTRWKKKSPDKRATILQKAFPEIFPTKWNGPHVFYDHVLPPKRWQGKIPLERLQQARKYHKALLVPWLNLPTLKDDPYKFLSLLNARTKYSPDAWVAFDSHQMRPHWQFGAYRTEFADCCVIFHGNKYGEVVPWDTTQVHRMEIIGYPRACLILEAQAIITKTLRGTVAALLEGIDTEGPSDKWHSLVNSSFRAGTGSLSSSNFTDQPFVAPSFNIDRLLEISKASFREAEDNLWLVQTDPAYLQYRIKLAMQGRIIKLGGDKMYNRAAYDCCFGPFERCQSWSWVVTEVEYVNLQYHKFRDIINLGEPLPKEYAMALASLELLLINLLNRRTENISELLISLVGFEHDYVLVPSADNIGYSLKPEVGLAKGLFNNDPLHWCLNQMGGDPENPEGFDASELFAFLADWLEKDTTTSQEKKRLQPHLLELLSDIAVNHELLAAVRQHRPRFSPTDMDTARKHGSDRPAWRNLGERARESGQFGAECQLLADLLRKVEAAPFPKGTKNLAWLGKADKVRLNSEALFKKMREIRLEQFQRLPIATKEDVEQEIRILSFDTAPDHISYLEAQRNSITQQKPRPQTLNQSSDNSWTSLSLSEITVASLPIRSEDKIKAHAEPPQITPTVIAPVPFTYEDRNPSLPIRSKEKIKTRPEPPQITPTVITPIPLADEDRNLIPTVQVKECNLTILSRMFPSTVEEFAAQPLNWNSFVAAMGDAGFLASQSGGSAVAFLNNENGGRINFHKPHPVAKVDQLQLQGFGKRMAKWFGWARDSFIVRPKSTSGTN